MRPLVVVVAVILLALPVASAEHFHLTEIEYLLPPDSIGAIDLPTFELPDYVRPFDEVLGLEIGGDARAYPMKVVRVHEIVNDVVGGVPVAVTFCSLCGSGIVYERPLWNGTPVLFHTSGLLYRNNKVMYDTATWSLWPQILGEAVNGSFHGLRLAVKPSSRILWSDWSRMHPGTLVLARPLPPSLWDYDRDTYEEVCVQPDGFFCRKWESYYTTNYTFKEWRHPDDRLHPKALVFGIVVGGTGVAYPLDLVARKRVINDEIGGVRLVIAVHNGSVHAYSRGEAWFTAMEGGRLRDDAGREYEVLTGEGEGRPLDPAPALRAFWFAWKDQYPGTYLYGADWPLRDFGAVPVGLALFLIALVPVSVVPKALSRRNRS